MGRKRILDEKDVRALTKAEIDDVESIDPDDDGGSSGSEILPDYEGDISSEDIENILNS